MCIIDNVWYSNFYGLPSACISVEQIYHEEKIKEKTKLSISLRLLSFLLFNMPLERISMIEQFCAPFVFRGHQFKVFSAKLIDYWQGEVINV